MIYVLDTDILSLLAYAGSTKTENIRERIAELSKEDRLVTTIINYEEQMRGWMSLLSRSKTSEAEVREYDRLHELITVFQRATILPYSAMARRYLRHCEVRRSGSEAWI